MNPSVFVVGYYGADGTPRGVVLSTDFWYDAHPGGNHDGYNLRGRDKCLYEDSQSPNNGFCGWTQVLPHAKLSLEQNSYIWSYLVGVIGPEEDGWTDACSWEEPFLRMFDDADCCSCREIRC